MRRPSSGKDKVKKKYRCLLQLHKNACKKLYNVNPRISPPGGLFIFDAFWLGAYSRGAYKII